MSDTSLDVRIPSYPGSPRSWERSEISWASYDDSLLRQTADNIHQDNALLEAAEIGDDKLLESILSQWGTNIQQLDHLGRNALHLALISGNERAVTLLLEAGVKPNVKDNVGMTPLSLCLTRYPLLRVAKLLFEYGACFLPRSNPMDTGLFLQFVFLCIPTEEQFDILELLVDQGALVNDPDAPGGRQALHVAAMSNNCKLIIKLVELGANLHSKNHRGETPREFATIFKCKEAVDLLEELEDIYTDTINSPRTSTDVNNFLTSQPSSDVSYEIHKTKATLPYNPKPDHLNPDNPEQVTT